MPQWASMPHALSLPFSIYNLPPMSPILTHDVYVPLVKFERKKHVVRFKKSLMLLGFKEAGNCF